MILHLITADPVHEPARFVPADRIEDHHQWFPMDCPMFTMPAEQWVQRSCPTRVDVLETNWTDFDLVDEHAATMNARQEAA